MSAKKTLSKDEIIHLGKLANLFLTAEEIKKYQGQLEETIEYIKNLEELDTSNTKPTSQTTNTENVFFEDGMKNERLLPQEEAVANAKNKKDGQFVVKRIM